MKEEEEWKALYVGGGGGGPAASSLGIENVFHFFMVLGCMT